MLMETVDTPDLSKGKHLNPQSLVKVERCDVKSDSNMFVVSKGYIRRKTGKAKYKRYTIKLNWMKYDG